jgi:hypothetical protein
VAEALDHPGPKQTWFLSTARPDGRPHSAGVGALWDKGKVYIVSGPGTQKSRNIASNPSVTVSSALDGMDVVIEGVAVRVTDVTRLEHIAGLYAESGWPARVENQAFTYDYSAPSAGPPPWYVYEIVPTRVIALLGEEPGGAMKYDFD